ncbi:response regulator [Paenibacillus sp. NPDC058071]|uniref:response regulator n=1 Tax=Paenibacillus sp. NPDC058071 TaxID=3346326 RepID=UPI0036DC409E
MSLRTKGLLIIVLISFVPLFMTGVSNYLAVRHEVVETAKDKAASQLKSNASQLASWLAIRRAEVLVMSRTDVVRFGEEADRLRYFHNEMVRSGFTYQSIGFIRPDGTAIGTGSTPQYMGGHDFFRRAMNGGVVMTDPISFALGEEAQAYIAVPVIADNNQTVGVVYASLSMSVLEPFLRLGTTITDAVTFRLYNEQGKVLFTTSRSESRESERFDGYFDEQSGVEVVSQNEVHFIFYEKVDNATGWRFALEIPESRLNVGLQNVFWRTFLTIALAEAAIVLSFFIFFAGIVRRLESILAVTEQAADGRFDAEHLNETPGDEVGLLASSVNGMMEHLKGMFGRLEAIINQNQYAFIVLDELYRVSYMNKAAEELIGYTSEELVGHATPLVFMDMEEIEKEAIELSERLGRTVQPGLEVFHELRLEKFYYEREWTFIHKDGTRIPVRHSSNGLLDQNGRFNGVVGMAYNISEHLQIEKARNRLQDIVESAQDLIASVDHRGSIIYMNAAGHRMLGNEPGGGKARIWHYMRPEKYRELVAGTRIAEVQGYWEGDTEFRRRDGENVHVSMVIVAHRNKRTGEQYFSSIARDITEQKHIQDELMRATQVAEEANEAKSAFLALMSHEIRTPLNGIIGLAQLMRRTELSGSQREYMDKMSTSSQTLLRLINDILDFSKIEAGKIETERLAFQPEELLGRLTDQLSVFMGGKEQFEFIVDSPADLPATLAGDPLRLEQVLLNLCMNAIKFTSRGRVILKLELLEQKKETVLLLFTVKDTGIGMTQEQLEKLFVPFTQADGSTTRKYGGSGLGLVISKSLVEAMGGSITVTSKPGQGSSFSFALCLPVLSPSVIEQLIVDDPWKGQPVWIVEDNDGMRQYWSETIESFQLTPVLFSSWKKALARLRRIGDGAKPKLVLLDMEMPDMYGNETWIEFRKAAEAAGVKTAVVTTTFGRDEVLQMPDELRPAALLTKPVTRMSMFRALSGALDDKGTRVSVDAAMGEVASGSEELLAAKARILLAEDNTINQLVAMEMLKEYGFEIGLAENGKEALLKLEQDKWDMVLMDIHMPEMDGMEATTRIRSDARYDRLPIIAVTANTLRSDHERYLRLGMNAVVTKPIDPEQLYASITALLGKPAVLPLKRPADKNGGAVASDEPALPVVPGMDMAAALARVSGKRVILLHMLEQFESNYENFADKLITHLENGETTAAKRMLHTLKGASSHLSASEIAAAAGALEEIVSAAPLNERVWRSGAAKLKEKLAEMIGALRS